MSWATRATVRLLPRRIEQSTPVPVTRCNRLGRGAVTMPVVGATAGSGLPSQAQSQQLLGFRETCSSQGSCAVVIKLLEATPLTTEPDQQNHRKPTAIDLFSGCGGLTQGLVDAGFEVLGAIERDPLAVRTFRANHPGIRVWSRDIRKVTAKEVMLALNLEPGQLDLLAGCPPCQGFSRMRTLNGTRDVDDDRNDLVFQYLKFVRVQRPRALMFENVPGLRSDARFGRLEEKLLGLGYVTATEVRNAAMFGVAQRRSRLILLAGRGFAVPFPPPVAAEQRRTVRDVIGKLMPPGNTGDDAHDVVENRAPHVRELIRRIPKDGGSRSALDEASTLGCHRRCDGFYDVYGRMAWDDVSPTLTSGFVNPSKGRFLHPAQDRCITPREAALLQSFPSCYKFPMMSGKYPVAAMIGNAFPPLFAQVHAEAVAGALPD
ncbi:MAG: DNA cytosine methyltransferase [Pseudomonadota bacterium]